MIKSAKLPIDIRPPEIVTREMRYPRRDIWILTALCIAMRLAMTPINAAEYTDGAIQAMHFAHPQGSIWPPLYSALIYPLRFLVGFEWAGRLISAVASGLAVLPLYLMTRRAFGTRAALYAGIFYITAPVANRWGIRLMTDATFSLFFWWACERLSFASDERNEKKARLGLSMGAMFCVLAALTRYQGLMLTVPVLGVAAIVWRRFGRFPLVPLLWLLGLAVLPVWIGINEFEFIHTRQFIDRAVEAPMPAWQVILLNAESFVLLMPYFVTYPVAVFVFMGMFQTRLRRGPFVGWLALFTALVLLFSQSAFSSFQERYFLPAMGFVWMFAGSGMFSLQERWSRTNRPTRARLFPWLMIFTFAFCAAFSALVLVGQREAFGDLARAARFARDNTHESVRILTNEVYRESPQIIAGDKVSMYAQRPAEYLRNGYVPDDFSIPPPKRIPEGSVVVLSSAYSADAYYAYLSRWYRLELLTDPERPEANPFDASILPIFPDIMSRPGTAQNPLAWFFRYEFQTFSTAVYVVREPRDAPLSL